VIARSWLRWPIALAFVVVAMLCRLALLPWLGRDTPFLPYLPAVMAAGLVGGFRAGLLATVASALAALTAPALDESAVTWEAPSPGAMAIFVATCVLISWVTARVRRELTALERARQQAVASERRAQGLLASIGDAFISVDRDWRIRYANDAALRFVNLQGAELIGRDWHESWTVFGEQARASCKQAMTDRATVQFDDVNDALDRTLDIRAFPADDGGMSFYVSDVTATRRATRAVAESERRLRVALRASGVGTWQADLESGSVTCSDEVLELLGLAPSDATGERLLGLINPEDVSTVLAARDRALSSANECAVEFRVRRADGTPAWFEVRGQSLRETGSHLAGVAFDVSARRDAEAKRLSLAMASARHGSAEASAESARARTRTADHDPAGAAGTMSPAFLSFLSHELRTPLNAIIGWCEVLRLGAHDPDQVTNAADVIKRNARAQAQMISDFVASAGVPSARPREAVVGASAASTLNPEVAERPSTRPAVVNGARLDGLALLVLEDDPDTRAWMQRLLEDAGAHVVIAGRAADALDLLARVPVHVIVSDIGLPEMDGYEFIRRVRALPPTAGGAVPAIALTSYGHADDRRRALLAGFQMHVVKPLKPEEFRTAIHTLATLSRASGLGPP